MAELIFFRSTPTKLLENLTTLSHSIIHHQTRWMFTAYPYTPNKRTHTHTIETNSLRGSTDVGHKSKGFLKKLPINRRVNSVQWAFPSLREL